MPDIDLGLPNACAHVCTWTHIFCQNTCKIFYTHIHTAFTHEHEKNRGVGEKNKEWKIIYIIKLFEYFFLCALLETLKY